MRDLTETEKLELHQRATLMMNELAEIIEQGLPEGLPFVLLTFTPGKDGYTGYVSNTRRDDVVPALRECADRLELDARPCNKELH